jgi:hypothetical protein
MTFFSRSMAIFFILGLFTSAFAADLTVKYQQVISPTISLPDGDRLDKFYAQEQLPAEANWHTSLLTNSLRQAQFETEKVDLMAKLNTLENRWLQQGNTALVQSIRQLKHELFQINVAGRIPAKLDPDLIRLRTEHNRPLVGSYTLYIGSQTDTFNLVGLINGKSVVKLQSGWSVEDYISDVDHQAGAESSYGYLIQGNGEWQEVPLAYWNKKHTEPSAGSSLFIGFKSEVLPEDMSDLNDHIAAYVANRIPQ